MTKEEIVEKIKEKRKAGKNVFICGNGGSAANAEHFATDLFKRKVRAHCLTSNSSIVTMLANDYGYDTIFSEQLCRYANPGDLVILVSCSGTSKNIMKAKGISILEYIEIFGGEGTYGEMESVHQTLMHQVSEML